MSEHSHLCEVCGDFWCCEDGVCEDLCGDCALAREADGAADGFADEDPSDA